jgi:hypothetical protein
MRSGVTRDGQHLYPTFPYDHFSNVTGEDDRALYAYLMSRKPVHARFQSLKVVTADTRRRIYLRQSLRAGQWHRDPERGGAGARAFCSLRPRGVSICRLKLCEPNTAQ